MENTKSSPWWCWHFEMKNLMWHLLSFKRDLGKYKNKINSQVLLEFNFISKLQFSQI